MKNVFLLGYLSLFSVAVQAQSADEVAVDRVIKTVFKSMVMGDSALLHSAFYDPATSATVSKDKSGQPVLHLQSSMSGFFKAVGTPHKEKWYEEVWNLKVQVDGDFAQAWCDYAFYSDKNFSHCGVDAFQLFRNKNGEWKIFHLADTRRKEGCEVPQEIKDRRTK